MGQNPCQSKNAACFVSGIIPDVFIEKTSDFASSVRKSGWPWAWSGHEFSYREGDHEIGDHTLTPGPSPDSTPSPPAPLPQGARGEDGRDGTRDLRSRARSRRSGRDTLFDGKNTGDLLPPQPARSGIQRLAKTSVGRTGSRGTRLVGQDTRCLKCHAIRQGIQRGTCRL